VCAHNRQAALLTDFIMAPNLWLLNMSEATSDWQTDSHWSSDWSVVILGRWP